MFSFNMYMKLIILKSVNINYNNNWCLWIVIKESMFFRCDMKLYHDDNNHYNKSDGKYNNNTIIIIQL